MVEPVEFVSIGYVLASIYLSPLLMYYYWKTKIRDYLIFSVFYFSLAIYSLSTLGHLFIPGYFYSTAIEILPSTVFLNNFIFYSGSVAAFVFYFLVILYFGRGIDTPLAKTMVKFDFGVMIMSFIIFLPLLFERAFFWDIEYQLLMVIRYGLFLLTSTSFMVILIDGLIELRDESNYHFENRRMEITWRTAMWIATFGSVGYLIKMVDVLIDYTNETPIIFVDNLYVISLSLGLLAIAIVMVISLFNPKGLLVFRYQIVRAVTLYKTLHKEIDGPLKPRATVAEIYSYVAKLSDEYDYDINQQI